MVLGYDVDAEIRILRNGQAVLATQMSPPWTEATTRAAPMQEYDPAAARALLDRFGYKDRDGDGYREPPDGKPLVRREGVDAQRDRPRVRRAVEEEHGRDRHPDDVLKQKWPDLVKMAEAGKLQMWNLGWILTIPDADTPTRCCTAADRA